MLIELKAEVNAADQVQTRDTRPLSYLKASKWSDLKVSNPLNGPKSPRPLALFLPLSPNLHRSSRPDSNGHCERLCSQPLHLQDGSTGLILASASGNMDVVKLLIDNKACVNAASKVPQQDGA